MDQIWRLNHFLAVAEVGSVQGAARSLNISQPALSKSLKLLEEHLQTALFDRSARGVVLTPMGQVFYRRAREIQSEWDGSLIDLTATRDGARGELRIGIGPTYAAVFMPRVLGRIARDYPNLRVSVRTGVGALLIPALQAGEISLYAGGLRTLEERSGEALDELFLYDQSNCIVAAGENPLARLDAVPLEELGRRQWVMLSYDTIARGEVDRLFRVAGMAPVVPAVTTESLDLALELVRRDGFLTSLPRPLLHPKVNPNLAPLAVRGYEWTIRSGVTYRVSMRSLAPVKSILSLLRQDVARLGLAEP
jgi:LysR family transcriptional regulator, regulator of abg operon